jgi:hypothetical protein
MSVLNSVSESQRSNRKDYKRLLRNLTNCFRHPELVGGDIEDDSDSMGNDSSQMPAEDNAETVAYVKTFRNKVEWHDAD